MKKSKFGFIVEYVNDIAAARRFYVDVLGLEVERESPEYIQFDHFSIASDEAMSAKREPETYWLVDDAEAAFKEMSPKAKVIFPITPKPFGKVFAIEDPAGQPLYLLEFAQNRPSRPVK